MSYNQSNGTKTEKKCQKAVTDLTNWRRNYNCTKLANIFLINDTDSGKHGMTERSGERSAELFSKTSELVLNGLNIPVYES